MRREKIAKRARAGVLTAALALPACADAEAPGAGGSRPDTDAWNRALERFQRAGGVDYAALAADRGDLDAFLAGLPGARPEEWPREERLAFWVNAYNAVVVDFVLELYPDVASVKEVDGFFDERTATVAGEEMTLDQIEGRARDMGDPRVHFAVVCASTSCPDLRGEAYRAASLDAQLAEDTRRFLADPDKGLRYDERENTLWLSSIFKWYAGDFTGGSTVVAFFARGRVLDWVLPHLPRGLAATLEERAPSVRYLDYDWSLNDRPGR